MPELTENKASSNNVQIAHLCDKLENSMTAYAYGHVEYACRLCYIGGQ